MNNLPETLPETLFEDLKKTTLLYSSKELF